jgi:hypothetical protein
LQEKIPSKIIIVSTILANPRTDDVVLAAFADTYLTHAAFEPRTRVIDHPTTCLPTKRPDNQTEQKSRGRYLTVLTTKRI